MPERCSVGLIDDYCVSDFEKSDDYHLLSRDYNIKLSISFKDDASPIGDIILEYKNEQVRYDSIDYAGCVDVNAKLFTSVKKKRFYILLNCMYEYSNEYYIFIIDGNQPRYLSSYSHSILSDKMVEYHYSINVIDNCETLIISEIYDGKEKVIHKQKI